MPARALNKIAQTLRLGHNHTPSSFGAELIKRRPLQTLAAEIQTDVQHAKGLLRIAPPDNTECVAAEAHLHGIQALPRPPPLPEYCNKPSR